MVIDPSRANQRRVGAPALLLGAALTLTLFGGCVASKPNGEAILAGAVVIDTHIDTPFRVERGGTLDDGKGQFDVDRALAGGLTTAFMSIFVPASVDEAGGGIALADRLIDHVEAFVAADPERVGLVTCAADVAGHKAAGRVGLALGMENGGPLVTSEGALEHFVDRGVRYVTLAHGKANALSDSSYDSERPWAGLSAAGRTMVERLNRLGVMVDVSHLSDAAFWQVLEVSAVPVIASHSSARRFVPGFERNMSDEMIRAIADRGGVVQVNFGSGFVTAQAREAQDRWQEVFRRFLADSQNSPDSPQAATFLDQYRADHPYPRATLANVLDHIDHMAKLAGVSHVGLGSDFDGVGDTMPTGLEDVSKYPNLVSGLIERGYDRRAIEGILGENLLRVWRASEAHAAAHGRSTRCAL